IALPRDLDKATGDQSPNKNVNTLVFQATVYMAALQHGQGNKYNISLYTGRTPPNNENSAKYFQPSARKDLLLPLIPNKLDGPHSFIPAIGEEKIKELEKEVRKARLAPADMQRSADVFRIFRETTTGVSDQAS